MHVVRARGRYLQATINAVVLVTALVVSAIVDGWHWGYLIPAAVFVILGVWTFNPAGCRS